MAFMFPSVTSGLHLVVNSVFPFVKASLENNIKTTSSIVFLQSVGFLLPKYQIVDFQRKRTQMIHVESSRYLIRLTPCEIERKHECSVTFKHLKWNTMFRKDTNPKQVTHYSNEAAR